MPSFSTRTVVYKGLLLAHQVEQLLRGPAEIRLRIGAWRWSTSASRPTPSRRWKLAHPYRFIAHNGEINTVRGNVNWMYARRRTMESDLLGADLDKMWPIIPHGQSDTACLDNALELLVAGGYPLRPRDDDADPGGLGRQSADGCQPQGLLRISRRADGAVGRPGRRSPSPTAARSARRWTATACARRASSITDDDLVDHGVGVRRAADPGREDRAQVAPAARQDAADRPRRRPHRRGRGDQAEARRGRALRGVAEGDAVQARGAAGARRTRRRRSRRTIPRPCSIASRPSATRRRTSSSSSSRWPATATTRSARWAPTRRSRCSRRSRSCSTTTSSRTSPRSPTRRSIRSARSW